MNKMFGTILTASIIMSAATAFGAVKAETFSVTPVAGGYFYEHDQDLDPALLLGIRAGYNFTKHIGIEAVYNHLIETDAKSGSATNISGNRFGGQALYHFFPENTFVPYVAAGYSGVNFNGTAPGIPTKTRGAFDYGIGAKYFLADDVALRGDIRHIMYNNSPGYYNNIELTLGAYVQFGAPAPAAKPIVIEPAPTPVVKVVPVPEPIKKVVAPVIIPPADSDKDGVIDSLDKCPGTPTGVLVDNKGCPIDSDMDGIADYLDKCPGTPAKVSVDDKGCPLDSDKDGVADYLDKCPGTPAKVSVDDSGCPLDSDKDGVVDYLDKCPNTPLGAEVDKNGCRVEMAKQLCEKPTILSITFDTNKSEVMAKYYEELDKLGLFLKEFPSATGIINGHTDSDGNNNANLKLSQARAESVRNYIITKFGIDGTRIVAKGYGETIPVASNKTKDGKAKNRRTEVVFTCK